MIFYEAPHKLVATLEDMADIFGADRPISLCRELTKLHEEVVRTTLGEAVDKYTENPPKGEFVLVIAGAPLQAKEAATEADAAARTRFARQPRSWTCRKMWFTTQHYAPNKIITAAAIASCRGLFLCSINDGQADAGNPDKHSCP